MPKEERKITNVIQANQALTHQNQVLARENDAMRLKLEEAVERGHLAVKALAAV